MSLEPGRRPSGDRDDDRDRPHDLDPDDLDRDADGGELVSLDLYDSDFSDPRNARTPNKKD